MHKTGGHPQQNQDAAFWSLQSISVMTLDWPSEPSFLGVTSIGPLGVAPNSSERLPRAFVAVDNWLAEMDQHSFLGATNMGLLGVAPNSSEGLPTSFRCCKKLADRDGPAFLLRCDEHGTIGSSNKLQ